MVPCAGSAIDVAEHWSHLQRLQASWEHYENRQVWTEVEWMHALEKYLESLVSVRVERVRTWMDVNTARFKTDDTTFQTLMRDFESLSTVLRSSVQLCTLQCAECQLSCLDARHHDGPHNCHTSHSCSHRCAFEEDHTEPDVSCGLPLAFFKFLPSRGSSNTLIVVLATLETTCMHAELKSTTYTY